MEIRADKASFLNSLELGVKIKKKQALKITGETLREDTMSSLNDLEDGRKNNIKDNTEELFVPKESDGGNLSDKNLVTGNGTGIFIGDGDEENGEFYLESDDMDDEDDYPVDDDEDTGEDLGVSEFEDEEDEYFEDEEFEDEEDEYFEDEEFEDEEDEYFEDEEFEDEDDEYFEEDGEFEDEDEEDEYFEDEEFEDEDDEYFEEDGEFEDEDEYFEDENIIEIVNDIDEYGLVGGTEEVKSSGGIPVKPEISLHSPRIKGDDNTESDYVLTEGKIKSFEKTETKIDESKQQSTSENNSDLPSDLVYSPRMRIDEFLRANIGNKEIRQLDVLLKLGLYTVEELKLAEKHNLIHIKKGRIIL